MFREHTPHPDGHPCACRDYPLSTVNGVTIGCVMPPMTGAKPNSNCGCCSTSMEVMSCDGSMETKIHHVDRDCEDGFVPVDVWLAKNDPLYEPVFGCYEYHEIAAILDRHLKYHICNEPQSILLAAAHFTQLHTIINPATIAAYSRQSSKPTAVLNPFPDALIKSRYGYQHWALTTFGMNYQDLRKPAIALAGLAWGA